MLPALGYAVLQQGRRARRTRAAKDPAVNALEIRLESTRDLPSIDAVKSNEFDLVSLNALGLAGEGVDPFALGSFETLAAACDEKLALSLSGRLDPPSSLSLVGSRQARRAREALSGTCRKVRSVQERLGGHRFYLEHRVDASPFTGWAVEAAFLTNVLERTACGWLLDVSRIYAHAMNGRFDAYELIEEVLPSASRVQLHLAGIVHDGAPGTYAVSSREPIPEAVLELSRFVLEMAFDRVDAIFVDRDPRLPGAAQRRREIHSLHEIVVGVGALVSCTARRRDVASEVMPIANQTSLAVGPTA